MAVNSCGVKTHRDGVVIDYDKETLATRMCDIASERRLELLKERYGITDTPNWKLKDAQLKIKQDEVPQFIQRLTYRPFDYRWIYYNPKIIEKGDSKYPTLRHMLRSNVASPWAAMASIASKLGCTTETLRNWVRLEGAVYSVWTCWAGLDVVIRVGPSTVTIVGRDGTHVHHPRKRFGERSIDYRHYLTELARKPQAVRQVLPELLRDLGAPFPAIWEQLHGAHGPRDAARLFAKVLGQLETQGAAVVVPALTAALATGTPLLLALTPARARTGIAPDAVPASLRDIEVGSGCAADYDGWLVAVGA